MRCERQGASGGLRRGLGDRGAGGPGIERNIPQKGVGCHTTSIAGVFGAAAAASRLLRLTSDQTAHALGLAASQASGINEYLYNGSSAKTLHCGWSAYAGLVAARMAQGGMTGPQSVFEGRSGLLPWRFGCAFVKRH